MFATPIVVGHDGAAKLVALHDPALVLAHASTSTFTLSLVPDTFPSTMNSGR